MSPEIRRDLINTGVIEPLTKRPIVYAEVNLGSGGKLDIGDFDGKLVEIYGIGLRYTSIAKVKYVVSGNKMLIFPFEVRHDYFFKRFAGSDPLLSAGLFEYSIEDGNISRREINPHSLSLVYAGLLDFRSSREYAVTTLAPLLGPDFYVRR